MIKLCVFDLDGTLLDTVHALTRVINLTLGEIGLPDVSENDVKYFVGSGYKIFVQRALKHFDALDKFDLEKVYSIYEKHFEAHRLYRVEPYEGIKSLLSALKEKGIKLAVLSNKSQEGVEDNIRKCFKPDFFDALYGEREKEGIKIKPAPDSLLAIIEDFGVKKEELLYFGDSDVDMLTSVNAGVSGVGVLWGFRTADELEKSGAKYIVERPEEILNLI